jgi:hypothetical protein
VAFIRRALKNKRGNEIPFGGHLAFPAGFFDSTDAAPNGATDAIALSNDELIDNLRKGAVRELEEEAPALAALLKDAQSEFKAYVSNKERDLQCDNVPHCLPSTSAVFVTKIKVGPKEEIQGADDAAGHPLVWVPRKKLLEVARKYKPEVQKTTIAAVDRQYTSADNFMVEDFAFDHLPIAAAALLC